MEEEAEECLDDDAWRDSDGDGCQVYAEHVAGGALSAREACSYGDGAARWHCRRTCGRCAGASETDEGWDDDMMWDFGGEDEDEAWSACTAHFCHQFDMVLELSTGEPRLLPHFVEATPEACCSWL